MINQAMVQSVTGKKLEIGYGTPDYNPSRIQVSQYSLGDRMFDRVAIPKTSAAASNLDPSNDKSKYTRKYFESDSKFNAVALGNGKQKKLYILAETSQDFLTKILWDKGDKKAIHINNGIMPGTDLKMEFLGIGGITFLSQFTLDHVPDSYSYERCVWQVSKVSQKVENKVWTTTVTAQARQLTVFEKL